MKILYVTTVGSTMRFFVSLVSRLIAEGHTVDIACGETGLVPEIYTELGCRIYSLDCSRSFFNKGNISSVSEIRKIAEDNHYDIVHCHTPIAAACTRLACRKLRKSGLKVAYTAHGFHFYKGAPMKSWLIFYPAEWFCSFFTDLQITINKEDYERACRQLHAVKTVYIPGVGIDTASFAETAVDKTSKRQALGISPEDYVILSVGELNDNKNHLAVIRALALMTEKERTHITYAVAGIGQLEHTLADEAAKAGVRLVLLGYRTDIKEIYKTADLYIHPSFREGLPLAVMEAQCAGLSVMAADIRGCRDLVKAGDGILFNSSDYKGICDGILSFYYKSAETVNSSSFDIYDFASVNQKMIELYKALMN